ncbi:YqgE/AlgH family protein [Bergeyella zoohelcum]|uniref:Uncharacterized protein n=2 Tax=Bergeyella zoohelcum TaxID=1015 RepID=K1LKU7_9FLAO|nr:YqgE/AlgH family protein [Bergeyella zoohelcum]EKB57370.1 hypothetical protein HMPREF9699_00856 [Bergeyella zoohelcum ATCC 43767]EKB60226.1 hypothetical protein HMPREF9700_01045 [Bergeyella zoohelcum CCUG 30536]MDY6025840.1 YqgE/AlgH family protein [Bergeyella zoohelcum]SUV48959.1 Uncharacterized ACR, COG1678 [Bergeyella zoohelcum]SUV53093.1 Uncharacterized ACR, COG1678 [Bergeyella zoohelcum]
MKTSYKGKLLISKPSISGDIFSRAVVLIIEHNEEGAFGLILNKRNPALSSAATGLLHTSIDVYEGGPVEIGKIFFIVKGVPHRDSHLALNENFYLTQEMENIIDDILRNQLNTDDIKVFTGYSGWERNQLDNEVANNFWNIIDDPSFDYTAQEDDTLWKNLMQNLGGENLLWANAPEDITMN